MQAATMQLRAGGPAAGGAVRSCGSGSARPQAPRLLRAQRGSRAPAVSVRAMQEAPGAGLSPEVRSSIDTLVNGNKVLLFMKGTKQFPQCGFSNTVVQILNSMGTPFETVNILADDRMRSGMKEYSQWPTFPQVYVGGEFVGGADILIQMYQSGELKELLERELNS